MQALPTWLRIAALAGAACWLLSARPAAAAPEYQRYYNTGKSAAESGEWEQVEKMMRRAIEANPEAKGRRLLRRGEYLPYYYLGLARYHQGDCPGALAAWADSESRGAIVGRDEYSDLLRWQDDCEDNGAPTRAASRPPITGGEPAPAESKKTGKEKVRTGQLWVEKGADPTRKALGAVGNVASEDSELGKVANEGEGVVDVLESATDIVDLALPASESLEAAINAYFAGNPQRTLTLLESIDTSDPRARAQVYLFRAAASFRLHLLSGRDPLLGKAREYRELFQQEQWRRDFPAELFDPRFVRFLRGG